MEKIIRNRNCFWYIKSNGQRKSQHFWFSFLCRLTLRKLFWTFTSYLEVVRIQTLGDKKEAKSPNFLKGSRMISSRKTKYKQTFTNVSVFTECTISVFLDGTLQIIFQTWYLCFCLLGYVALRCTIQWNAAWRWIEKFWLNNGSYAVRTFVRYLKNMQKTDRYIFHSSKASFSAQ